LTDEVKAMHFFHRCFFFACLRLGGTHLCNFHILAGMRRSCALMATTPDTGYHTWLVKTCHRFKKNCSIGWIGFVG
jgi:hypothetical protein